MNITWQPACILHHEKIPYSCICHITDGRCREGVTRLVRAGRMTCKVRRDFKIITDVLSRVSLVTSNIRGSSICSPKSLYKKTSNEILVELKAVVKTGALKVPEAPARPTPVCYGLSAMTGVCQTASSHPHPVTTDRKGEEGRIKMNFSSCSDHSLIKKTAIFSSLAFEFGYFFFCGLLSLQHKTLVLLYTSYHRKSQTKLFVFIIWTICTIVFIFIAIFTTFQPISLSAIFRCFM